MSMGSWDKRCLPDGSFSFSPVEGQPNLRYYGLALPDKKVMISMRDFPVLSSEEYRRLLDGLSAGVDKPLFSPDDWAARLDGGSAARRFVTQLRAEWLPVNVPDDFCQRQMDFVRHTLQTHPGWQHLWAHTLRVTGMVLALVSEVDVEPIPAFLLAVFHDIGKLEEMDGHGSHEEIGAEMARTALSGRLVPLLLESITGAIAKRANGANRYARLIHDADKLDKIGATGIARRLSTSARALHVGLAFRRIEDDLNSFPAMSFPSSIRMAVLKKEFTETFLSAFQRPGSEDAL